MQKRNVQGIERVIFLMTKKLEQEPKGPSNKSAVALARLVSAYNRAVRPTGTRAKNSTVGMSEEDKQRHADEYGDPNFYASLCGGKE